MAALPLNARPAAFMLPSSVIPPSRAMSRIATLETVARYEQVIKKSRFVAVADRVRSVNAVREFVREHTHPKATHNVYAYRLASGATHAHNDGEPSNTAGPPVLAAITNADLHDCVVVVTRYYGGVQLGTGGLVRAYGGTASACLSGASIATVEPSVAARVRFAPQDTAAVYALLAAHSLRTMPDEDENGWMVATFEAPVGEVETLDAALRRATAGRLAMVRGDAEDEEGS